MKGVSYWMWVVGGVIAGLVLFSLAYIQISQIRIAAIEQKSIEQLSEIKSIINTLCWSFKGNKREYSISLDEKINGIYAARDKYKKYEKGQLVDSITSCETSDGNFLCVDIETKRVRCEELDCNFEMSFIGSVPEEFSLSVLVNRLIGKGRIYEYGLEFEKREDIVQVVRTCPE